MTKKELYRQVYYEFKDLCARGRQPGTFETYCKSKGVRSDCLRLLLGEEFKQLHTLEGYTCLRRGRSSNQDKYMQVYMDYKELCGKGEQPGSFKSYCQSLGYGWQAVYQFLYCRNIRITGIQGYESHVKVRHRYESIPFEQVIFEESGFLPADGINVITVKVDGHVSVSFPADTDVDVVAKFVRKLGKEVSHVGS